MTASAPFCGPENGAAAVGTTERIRYIAGNTEGAFRKFRQNVICRNRGKRFQPDGTKRNLFSFCIEQSETECLQHTNTAVIRGTSADSDNKMAAATQNRILDYFTDTVCRCIQRISLRIRNKRNSSCTGHLNNSCLCLFYYAIRTRNCLFLCRPRHRNGHKLSAESFRQSLYRPFSSVRQCPHNRFNIWIHPCESLAQQHSRPEEMRDFL